MSRIPGGLGRPDIEMLSAIFVERERRRSRMPSSLSGGSVSVKATRQG